MKALKELQKSVSAIVTEYNYLVALLFGAIAVAISQFMPESDLQDGLFWYFLGSGFLCLAGNYAWDLLEIGAYKFQNELVDLATEIVDGAGIKGPQRNVMIAVVRKELSQLTPNPDLMKQVDEIMGSLKGK